VVKARIGSRIGQLFAECGGFHSFPKRIAVGSPLLGRSIFSLDEPVNAYTNAVFAISEEASIFNPSPQVLDLRSKFRHIKEEEKEKTKSEKAQKYAQSEQCIGCGECRKVCPVGLDPEKLYKLLAGGNKTKNTDKANEKALALASRCHGCGCCVVVCPSSLPLSHIISNSNPEAED
jgi:electron transport complex protein RnfC